MIKKIHFIWLGSKLPLKNRQMVIEWKSLMPDFEFVLWNEENTKKYDCLFLRQCLRKKAYAFAADYLRLSVVNDYGGFYLDTDMKLIKRLQIEQNLQFQICEEVENRPNWGYFYSTPKNQILLDCLKKYDNFYFDEFKPPVIPYFLKGIILDNKANISILPPEYFYPLPMNENPENYFDFVLPETIGVHMWDFSWCKFKKSRTKFREIIYRLSVLFIDFFTFQYPPYYYRINSIRIYRLLMRSSK